MEADVNLQVGVLSEADSWRLFRLKAGDVADSSSHREVAQDVLSECKGLPLAIVTLGLALRNKDRTVWLDARTRLKRSVYKGMDHVITIVKLSYEFFQDDKAAQMCFLFCSLFPEDFLIETDVLLSYVLGEELLGKEDNMEEARNRLHAIIDKLASSGMLLRSYDDGVMMHDIIRDAAISIASDPEEGEGFIVRSGLGLKEWPTIDREMETCRRLSLMGNNLSFLPPHQITPPLLLTLSVYKNPNLKEIPSVFFKGMKHLKTLDLSETGITSLPESLQCLKSLHTLLMDNCDALTNISLVGELEMLEILSIRYSYNVQIPVSIQKLTNLKVLNADGVKSLCPQEVISSLRQLEELSLNCCDIQTQLVFQEVASLNRLTAFNGRLPVECMLEDFPSHWKNLSKFHIHVGKSDYEYNEFESGTRMFSLALGSPNQNGAIELSNWAEVLSEEIDALHVYDYDDLLIFEDLNENSLYQNLLHLHICNCAQLRHLLNTRKPLFCNLDALYLDDLDDFVAICEGPLPKGCLSKLRWLYVAWCPTLRALITADLLGNLQNLEDLSFYYCHGLEELIEFEGFMSQQAPSLFFPCLRSLTISSCDKLKYGLPLKAAQNLMQLEYLNIEYCSGMEVAFEGVRGNRYDADRSKAILPRLKTLVLRDLPSLTNFGPQGLLLDFPALVRMVIADCGSMKSLPFMGKDKR